MRFAYFSLRSVEREQSIACVAGALSLVPGVQTVTIHVTQGIVEVGFDATRTAEDALCRAAAATGHVMSAVSRAPDDDRRRARAAIAHRAVTSGVSPNPGEGVVEGSSYRAMARCRQARPTKNMTET
ncbi:MAG: hypothetical protein MUC34_00110 [Anaerolineae bacterium]|jgi:hypothetical protein|nr:hypothetical protein [Anaerolineae bacterium]